MKLTSVEIHPENSSDVAILSFRDTLGLNPYNVKAIVGLDANDIVNFSLQKRDIVIRIGLNPSFATNQSYSDLRDLLYKMISSSRIGEVQIQFKNGANVVAAISGVISKFETPHFEKNQEVQLTVSCDETMLKALTRTIVPVGSLDPALTIIQDVQSTAPHGFKFNIFITDNIPSLAISDPDDPSWIFEIVPLGGFLPDDDLFFSSESNDKQLYIERGISTIQLADAISLNSIWPTIYPGSNKFSFTHSINLIWGSISYFRTYWGV